MTYFMKQGSGKSCSAVILFDRSVHTATTCTRREAPKGEGTKRLGALPLQSRDALSSDLIIELRQTRRTNMNLFW